MGHKGIVDAWNKGKSGPYTQRCTINSLALPLGFSSNANYAMAILRDGKQTIWNFKFNTTNEDDFDSKEIQTSTNSSILMKMHNLLELLRNQPSVLWLWIGCSSSCFKYRGLYITTVD